MWRPLSAKRGWSGWRLMKKSQLESFAASYAADLRDYLSSGDESALGRGAQWGNQALAAGLELATVAVIHHAALKELASDGRASGQTLVSAGQFLAQALSPIEAAARPKIGQRSDPESKSTVRQRSQAGTELESFANSVAHDLRGPLNVISGFSRILMRDYAARLDPNGQSYLKYVSDSAERMSQVVDGLARLCTVTGRG